MWKNCATAWHDQDGGTDGTPAVTLEAIADHSLCIWHAFIGMPGVGNDINALNASLLTIKIACGEYPPPVEYNICSQRFNIPYWLADGI